MDSDGFDSGSECESEGWDSDSSDSGSECESEGFQADAARLKEEVRRAIQVAVISAVMQEVDSEGTECESGAAIILSDQYGGARLPTRQQHTRRKTTAAAVAVAEAAAAAHAEELAMAAAVDRWFAMASCGMYMACSPAECAPDPRRRAPAGSRRC